MCVCIYIYTYSWIALAIHCENNACLKYHIPTKFIPLCGHLNNQLLHVMWPFTFVLGWYDRHFLGIQRTERERKKWFLIVNRCYVLVEWYRGAFSLDTHTWCDSIIIELRLFLHNRTYPVISVVLFKVVFRVLTKSAMIAPYLKHFMKLTVWHSVSVSYYFSWMVVILWVSESPINPHLITCDDTGLSANWCTFRMCLTVFWTDCEIPNMLATSQGLIILFLRQVITLFPHFDVLLQSG